MARNLFKSALRAIDPNSIERIRQRLADAEQAVEDAEREWRNAAFEAEAGGDPAVETAAAAALTKARQEVIRLEAVLAESEARTAVVARAEAAKRRAKEDADLAKACDGMTAAAETLASAIATYSMAYKALLAAQVEMSTLAATNPRARPDLINVDIAPLVGLELGRVFGDHSPPVVRQLAAAVSGTPTLGEEFAGLARAMKAGLANG